MAVYATVTAIFERLVLTLSEIKDYLGIPLADTSQDATLNIMLNAAKRAADKFCNNPFTHIGADGETIVTDDIPEDVKLGVMQLVSMMHRSKDGPVASETAGDLSVDYVSPTQGGLYTMAKDTLLKYHRLKPGI